MKANLIEYIEEFVELTKKILDKNKMKFYDPESFLDRHFKQGKYSRKTMLEPSNLEQKYKSLTDYKAFKTKLLGALKDLKTEVIEELNEQLDDECQLHDLADPDIDKFLIKLDLMKYPLPTPVEANEEFMRVKSELIPGSKFLKMGSKKTHAKDKKEALSLKPEDYKIFKENMVIAVQEFTKDYTMKTKLFTRRVEQHNLDKLDWLLELILSMETKPAENLDDCPAIPHEYSDLKLPSLPGYHILKGKIANKHLLFYNPNNAMTDPNNKESYHGFPNHFPILKVIKENPGKEGGTLNTIDESNIYENNSSLEEHLPGKSI